ncbi:cation:proton antiporter [Candidatus Woesearchaeota archaeon]|nr:cation:proton antiporter [Candidatus Woesearchaeota archaeon]
MDLIIVLIAISFLVMIFAKPFFTKLNIPLSFSAMFVGMVLGVFPLFQETANTDTFSWFANLGMLFMIFSIIFQMKRSNHKQDKALGKYLIKAGIKVITLELLIIFPVVYFFLEKNVLSTLLISLIFTTVAEVMIIPFLKKFNIINTKLGKSIVGIGVLDNAFEYLVILVASFSSVGGNADIKTLMIASVGSAIAFVLIRYFSKTKYIDHIVKNLDSNGLFLLSIGALFLFSGILSFIGLEFLGAVIAAILIRSIVKDLPKKHHDELNEIINASSEGLFGPIFFLWVGVTTNLMYLVQKPGLAIIFVLVGLFAKILPTIIATAKEMNIRSSIILGIALKFGSGIIFVKLLFEKGMITELTYTLTVAAILTYRILIPLLLGYFITKWKKDLV